MNSKTYSSNPHESKTKKTEKQKTEQTENTMADLALTYQ